MEKAIVIKVPATLHLSAKILAAQEGISLKEFVIRAISEAVRKEVKSGEIKCPHD